MSMGKGRALLYSVPGFPHAQDTKNIISEVDKLTEVVNGVTNQPQEKGGVGCCLL